MTTASMPLPNGLWPCYLCGRPGADVRLERGEVSQHRAVFMHAACHARYVVARAGQQAGSRAEAVRRQVVARLGGCPHCGTVPRGAQAKAAREAGVDAAEMCRFLAGRDIGKSVGKSGGGAFLDRLEAWAARTGEEAR